MRARPSATLEELEEQRWGEATFDSSLVHRVHRLRRTPICELTVEDLRVMLGQVVGLEHLLPLVLDLLEADPWIGGDLHPGDLLDALIRPDVVAELRDRHPERLARLRAAASAALARLDAPGARGGDDPDEGADAPPIELRDRIVAFLAESAR